MPRTRRPYPSDLTAQEWNLLEPLLASPERRGRPLKWPARHIADAVFYLLRSGCAWRMLPREYPPWQTVYYHLRKWRLDGRLRQAHERLRAAVRESEGRNPHPSGAVIDSQALKGSGVGGRRARLRWGEASIREETPIAGGHRRVGARCKSACRIPARPRRWAEAPR
jgi:putative transposase